MDFGLAKLHFTDSEESRSLTAPGRAVGTLAYMSPEQLLGMPVDARSDIQNGRLFAADLAELKKADDGIPQTVAPIEEIQLYVRDASGNRMGVSMRELVERTMGASVSCRFAYQSNSRR